MTPIDQLKALCEARAKATQGKWTFLLDVHTIVLSANGVFWPLKNKECTCEEHYSWGDAYFISKAGSTDFQAILNEMERLQKEVDEQCRLNGMGQERELKLMTERDGYKEALFVIIEGKYIGAQQIAQKALDGK